jgi:hypothetical protein
MAVSTLSTCSTRTGVDEVVESVGRVPPPTPPATDQVTDQLMEATTAKESSSGLPSGDGCPKEETA